MSRAVKKTLNTLPKICHKINHRVWSIIYSMLHLIFNRPVCLPHDHTADNLWADPTSLSWSDEYRIGWSDRTLLTQCFNVDCMHLGAINVGGCTSRSDEGNQYRKACFDWVLSSEKCQVLTSWQSTWLHHIASEPLVGMFHRRRAGSIGFRRPVSGCNCDFPHTLNCWHARTREITNFNKF